MKGYIADRTPGRVRVVLDCEPLSFREADVLEYYLEKIPGVKRAYAHDLTHCVTVILRRPEQELLQAASGKYFREEGIPSRAALLYDRAQSGRPYAPGAYLDMVIQPQRRTTCAALQAERDFYRDTEEQILQALRIYEGPTQDLLQSCPENPGRQINREYQMKLIDLVGWKLFRMFILPAPIENIWTIVQSLRCIWRGLRTVKDRKLRVEQLDAISVGVSVLRGDYATAGTVMFLLQLGDLIEEWTRKKAVSDLARSMSLHVDKVWIREGSTEMEVPISGVKAGDTIVVRSGSVIPLDGKILEGEVLINQASMTGESMPVRGRGGDPVYAGTVLEEGECTIEVTSGAGSGRYDKIVHMIEGTEKMKSDTENKAVHLADRLVPFSLAGTALTLLLTRNVNKAVSVLMVDYSCALKLSIPLAVLSAIRECGEERIVVKGGRYMESVAKADTIVFDKTGTLTRAVPRVVGITPFGGSSEEDVLRIAACLEEHYPHSMASAVVKEAASRGITHDEMHSQVQYVVAHGIASHIDGRKAIIGSAHFVFEDEKTVIPEGEQEKYDCLAPEYSHLYMAIDGVLAGVISIADPIRDEVPQVLAKLRALGISNIVMMTGDGEKTAAAIARKAGIDRYFAEVLPEDKAGYVTKMRQEGHTVIMVGDGINDSPALSAADAGIAISDGAAIARQIADITMRARSLEELVFLRRISMAMNRRVKRDFRFVVAFNTLLIVLGVMGILPAQTSALLHNSSTLLLAGYSMTNLLPQ